ncbi:MAG: hypothetical protein GX200_05835 [Firmicutes bacterium]|nr:hypothetical protein [Bacillota bacterium]
MLKKAPFVLFWLVIALFLLPVGLSSWQDSLRVQGSITTTEWAVPETETGPETGTVENDTEPGVGYAVDIEEADNSVKEEEKEGAEGENAEEEYERTTDQKKEDENGQIIEENKAIESEQSVEEIDGNGKEAVDEYEVVMETEVEQVAGDTSSNNGADAIEAEAE